MGKFFCSFLPMSIAVSFKTNPGLEKRLEFQVVLWVRSCHIMLAQEHFFNDFVSS